jgi:tetratricopeptide (TPR) repeat protein
VYLVDFDLILDGAEVVGCWLWTGSTMSYPSNLGVWLATIALAGCFSSFAFAQGNGRGLSIGGTVRDEESHETLSAVALELQAESGKTASPAVVSGTNGQFQFDGLNSGNFRILAKRNGYQLVSLPVTLGATSLSYVLVSLHRSAGEHAPAAGDAISAHQLSIPENARDAFEKGFKLLNGAKPDYHKALSFFERAIKAYPEYYEAYAEAGIAQHRLGDKRAAEENLRKSVELSASKYTNALMWLAEMLNDDGRFNDAGDFARRCATQDDSSWRCDLELARALAGLKRPAEAEAVATKASELNPNYAGTFLVLGNIHIQQRKFAAVVKDFDTYLKLEPSGPQSDQVRTAQAQARQALAKTQTRTVSPQPR